MPMIPILIRIPMSPTSIVQRAYLSRLVQVEDVALEVLGARVVLVARAAIGVLVDDVVVAVVAVADVVLAGRVVPAVEHRRAEIAS